jgi:hypothetical protein
MPIVGPMTNGVERVLIETDRHRIVGSVRLPTEGYRNRLTDLLNAAEREFIPITDAVVEGLGDNGVSSTSKEFLLVGKRHVVLAMLAAEAERD